MKRFLRNVGKKVWFPLLILLAFLTFLLFGELMVEIGVLDYCSGYNEADPNHCHEVP